MADTHSTASLRIDAVKITNRHRKHLGNIDALAASIASIGLLHPIVVSSSNTLIAGFRRLKACESLQWSEVPVRVIDLDSLLVAERDENTCREAFTPSEAVAIARTIEEQERENARKRQIEAGKQQGNRGKEGGRGKKKETPSENFSEGVSEEPILKEKPKESREIAAEAVGLSAPTYKKAEAVIKKAEENPDLFGDLVEQMDQTGKVSAAYSEMKRREEEGTKEKREKKWSIDDDIQKIVELVDRLEKNWTTEFQKKAIAQCLQNIIKGL